MTLHYMSGEASNPDASKRKNKVLSLNEKIKYLDFLRKRKIKHMLRLLKIYTENEFSLGKIIEKGKKPY